MVNISNKEVDFENWENMCSLDKISETFWATLDPVMEHNAMLRQHICKAKLDRGFQVLDSVLKDTLQENQELQNELACIQSQNTVRKEQQIQNEGALMEQKGKCLGLKPPQDDKCELETEENQVKDLQHTLLEFVSKTEIERTMEPLMQLEKKIALLSRQKSYLQELYQGLPSKLTEAEALKEQCDQFKADKDCICEEKYAALQDFIELHKKESRNLEEEMERLTNQIVSLQEEFKCFKSKLKTEDIEERLIQLKAETGQIREENEAVHEGCKELREKVNHLETVQEECRNLEEELEILRDSNGKLQDEFEQLKSKSHQEYTEELYVQLKSEKDHFYKENTQLRDNMFKLLQEFSQESCWKKKSEAIKVSKTALENENEQLKDFLWDITQAYDKKRIKEHAYKKKVFRIRDLKAFNERKQQEIDKMLQKNIILKVKSKSYKDIDKEEANLEALNKKLVTKKLKLEKKLQKFEESEVEIQEITNDISHLRKKCIILYREHAELEDFVAQKEQLKVHLKTLKSEKKSLMQRQNDLKREISQLDMGGTKRFVDRCVAESKRFNSEIKDLQHMNDRLQTLYEDMFVAVYSQEMLECLNDNSKKEIEAMKKLNKAQSLEIRQHRNNMKPRAGPSSVA